MQFRKGQGTTFRSGGNRSGGAYGAESRGLESSRDAAKRLRTTRTRLEDAETEGLAIARWRFEQHHHNLRSGVVLVDYRTPQCWDAIIAALRGESALLVSPSEGAGATPGMGDSSQNCCSAGAAVVSGRATRS